MDAIKQMLGKIYNKNVKFFDLGIIAVILALGLLILGQYVGGYGVYYALQKLMANDDTGFWNITYMYASFIGIWLVFILYILATKKNRPILKALWTAPRGNNIKFLLIGLLIGFGTNMLCAVAAMLNKDIHIYFDSFHPLKLLVVFIAVFIQSSAEELTCRGFLYQRLRKTFRHPAVAIFVNSALFGVLHLGNNGVTTLAIIDIIVTGIFFTFMVYYMDSIWCAFGVHTAWNFTQNIILGLPNSGNVSPFSIFKLDAASARNSFAYDVGFGVEGTYFAIAVQIIGAIVIFLLYRNKKERDYDTWNLAQQNNESITEKTDL